MTAALTDTFPYQVTDGLTPSAIRTVTVNLKSRAWFVKNDAAAGGLGRSNDPFDTLAAAQTASVAGDYIFVYGGSLTNTGQTAGFTLKANQKLYGEAIRPDHRQHHQRRAEPGAGRRQPCQPAGHRQHGAHQRRHLGAQHRGVEVRGVSVSGTQDAIDVTTNGANSGGAMITGNVIRLPGVDGIHVAAGGSGAVTLAISEQHHHRRVPGAWSS